MSSNVVGCDAISISSKQDVQDKISSPLAKVIGEWRSLACSPDREYRKKALKSYKVVLAEISKFKSALEDVLQYMVYEDDINILNDYIQQINDQIVRIADLVAVLNEEFVLG